MADIPKWQRVLAQRKLKKQIIKQYNVISGQLEGIKDQLGDLIEKQDEDRQLHSVIIVCAELIAGFEEKKDQDFIVDMVKTTLDNLD